jgi:phosphate transport system substrate-binding protein
VSRKKIRLAAMLSALAVFAAMPVAADAAKRTITISGSTSVFPLETKLARAWIKTKQGKKYAFKVSQGGSNVGVSDVAKGRVSIGASSRDPAPSDPGGLVFTRIARDALCIVTNPGNKLANINTATVSGIYKSPAQAITNWNDVPGSPISGTIGTYGRLPTSGTHDAFRNIFLGGTNQGNWVSEKASNGLVAQSVKGDPQGIGYVSLAFGEGLNVVAFNNVACTLRNAKSLQYGGTRSFYFVTRGNPVGGVKKFIGWITKSKKARNIVDTEWVALR